MPRKANKPALKIQIIDRYAGLACKDSAGVFDKANEGHPTLLKKARSLCSRCPIRQTCLEDALLEETDLGLSGRFCFRGGATPKERLEIEKRLKIERRRAARPTPTKQPETNPQTRPTSPQAAAPRSTRTQCGDAA